MPDSRPLGSWVALVDRLLDERFAGVLEEHGVSRGQWRLLSIVSAGGATVAAIERELAPFSGEEGMPVSDQVAELVESDWLVLSGAEYRLTERGANAHARLAEVVEELSTAGTEGISSDDYAVAVAALERMARNLGFTDR